VHAGFCGYDTRRTGVFIDQVTRMVDECGSGVNAWCRIDESMFDVENLFLRYTYGLLGCGTIGCKQVGKDHRV
jgi:hypothetical protein